MNLVFLSIHQVEVKVDVMGLTLTRTAIATLKDLLMGVFMKFPELRPTVEFSVRATVQFSLRWAWHS